MDDANNTIFEIGPIKVKTIEGDILLMEPNFSPACTFREAKESCVKGCDIPLPEHLAELIRNAYAYDVKAVLDYFTNNTFWADQIITYLVNYNIGDKIFNGAVVADYPQFKSRILQLPEEKNLDILLQDYLDNKEAGRKHFESKQGNVYFAGEDCSVRIVEGYDFERDFQGFRRFAENPLMMAVFNSAAGLDAVARFAADSRYFREDLFVWAPSRSDVEEEGCRLVRAVSIGGMLNGFCIDANAWPDHPDELGRILGVYSVTNEIDSGREINSDK